VTTEPDFAGGLEPPRLTTPRAAGVAGLVFAALFTAGIVLSRSFASLAPTEMAAELAGSLHSEGSAIASYLVPFAGIAFLWFIGVVRDRIGVHEDKLFATVFLGSGVLFVTMLFGAASVLAAMTTLTRATPATIELGRAIARSMLYLYGARSAGVFTIVTSTIVLRTGAHSKLTALAGLAIGLTLLLSVQYYDLIILLFPSWVALLSVLILVHARRQNVGADLAK